MKKLSILLTILFASAITVFCAGNDIFKQADEAFGQRVRREKAFEALQLYKEIYDKNKNSYDAAWRYSMTCYFAGFEYTEDRESKLELFQKGIEAGLIAIELNPESAEAYFWIAINTALYGETVGVIKMLFSLRSTCKYLEKSIEINPSYAYGGAYRVLGKINESLPGLFGGSKKKALEYYHQAINVAPDEPVNYIFAARLLYYKLKDKNTAKKYAEKGLVNIITDKSRHESIKAQKEIKEFLKLIADK